MRRGELSLNIIVIAAIALIVLVVLSVIFIGRGQLFQRGLNQCKGTCLSRGSVCDGAEVPTNNCDDGKKPPVKDGICCVPV